MAIERVGFIGGGKMAGAMVAGLVRGGVTAPERILVADIDGACREGLRAAYGVRVTAANPEVVAHAGVIVLAVKPQHLDEVLAEIAGGVGAGHLLISIAAGRRLAHLEGRLPAGRLARAMPNLAAVVGQSMSVYCLGARCLPGDAATVRDLLASFGQARALPESVFDGVTALSGSGPAFVAYYVEALARGGMALGLAEADAFALAVQTALGAARMLADGGYTPASLIRSVSSARGTTAAGLDVLTRTTLVADVQRTLEAAAARSRELSGATSPS